MDIYNFIKSIYKKEIILNDRKAIAPLELDIYIPDLKLGIELDGLYWHSEAVRPNAKESNARKTLKCCENNISLFAFYEDEWKDNQSLIKEMIKHRLGMSSGIKLRASSLVLKKLMKNNEYDHFFQKFHIDGQTQASFAYGLFEGSTMVACASFRKGYEGNNWEIARFAINYNYQIHGAMGKFLKQFSKDHGGVLITYSNNRLSRGLVYSLNGFVEVTKNPKPSYFYTDFATRIYRTKCKRINELDTISKYPTEKDQALNGVFSLMYLGHDRPLYKIYDYGHRKWEKKYEK